MKKFILFIAAFLLPIVCFAETSNTKQPEKRDKVDLYKYDKDINDKSRHRMPARHNDVECFYEDGYLHLTFEYPEGNATISITDIMDTPCLTQQFSTSTPFTIYIGEPTEPLNIKVTTEANIYIGMLVAL